MLLSKQRRIILHFPAENELKMRRQCSQIRTKVYEKLIIVRWKVSDGDTDSEEQCRGKETIRN
jgi:hypothetical protein